MSITRVPEPGFITTLESLSASKWVPFLVQEKLKTDEKRKKEICWVLESLVPGLFLIIVVSNLLGDGLRDNSCYGDLYYLRAPDEVAVISQSETSLGFNRLSSVWIDRLTWDEASLWPRSGWWCSPSDQRCNPLGTAALWWEVEALGKHAREFNWDSRGLKQETRQTTCNRQEHYENEKHCKQRQQIYSWKHTKPNK